MSKKVIILDDVTREFLSKLRELRHRTGLTILEIAKAANISVTQLQLFETGAVPTLGSLMKLAEFYDYDISGSINYKYFHGQINYSRLRLKIRFYGFTIRSLAKRIGRNEDNVSLCLGNVKDRHCSLLCLADILNVLKQEELAYRYRKKFLGETSRLRTQTNQLKPKRKKII